MTRGRRPFTNLHGNRAQSWAGPAPVKVWRCPILVGDRQCGRLERHDGRHDADLEEARWSGRDRQSAEAAR